MFSTQHRGNSIQLRTQLLTTKKGELNASEYYLKMTSLVDTMTNIGHPMLDEEVIGYILAGLGPCHDDLFTAIIVLSNQDTITLPELYSYLIAHEAQSSALNNVTEITASANQATRQDSNSSRRNQDKNSSHNYQRNSNRGGGGSCDRGRGLGRSNGGPRCQVCGIRDHITLNCIK
ncbi:uncharacterized protein LOC128132442 [Lactuca sativa]|uniref:uncharacterized protein LOC128132442 n=1 Tax=Lactuca sativa TaxID=4236 RepID=UPI0022AFEA0E|nr:uncharacterized protein LOC128132442 [Lactuca sativa]